MVSCIAIKMLQGRWVQYELHSRKVWHIVKDHIMEIVKEMHDSGSFLNSSFVVLIAKVERARNMREFRPISLVACIYKLISEECSRCWQKSLGNVSMPSWRVRKY